MIDIYGFKHVSAILNTIENDKIDEDNLITYLTEQRDLILTINRDIDGLLLFYSGHGYNKSILFSDGERYQFREIYNIFDNKNAPLLIGKPKIFHWDCKLKIF